MSELRRQVLPAAQGSVLEVGIGSALNLPYYSSSVTQLCGIDPSSGLLQMARRNAVGMRFPVTFLNRSAEEIPLEDRSVDTVVTTFSLCSMQDSAAALKEMRRVLKSDGRLLFLEHGLAADPKIQAWQNRLAPLSRRALGGCCPNKKIDDLIASAGFAIRELHNSYMPGPKPMTYLYRGFAERS